MWSSQSRKVWLGLVVVSTVVACGQPVTRDGATGPATGAGADEVLYVLDPNGESLTSRVVRIDPRTQRIERSYPAGYDPALALSPDGTRLYVASARQHGDELTDALVVVDTTSGKVLSTTPVEDRWEGAGVQTHQSLAPSPDGLWLYVLQARLTGGAGVEYSVATFDTTRHGFLSGSIPLGSCGAGVLVPSAQAGGRRLQVVCPETHDVRVVEVGTDGSAVAEDVIALPRSEDNRTDVNRNPLELWRLSSAMAAPSGEELYAVTQNGRVITVDLVSKDVAETVTLELASDTFVPIGQVAAAGERLFIGTASLGGVDGIDRLRASRVLVVDATEWVVEESATQEAAFEAFDVSPDGETVFVVDTEEQTVTAIDGDDPSQRSVMRQVGRTPTRIEAVGSPM
jgi:DNA-binding beta-propeller fold protein YncE